MNRIILIGNGFDLAHGLKTGYGDFIYWYWRQKFAECYSGTTHIPNDNLVLDSFQNELKQNQEYSEFDFLITPPQNSLKKILSTDHSMSKIATVFLDLISRRIEQKGWVDIENEYYRLIKYYALQSKRKSIIPDSDLGGRPAYCNPLTLNENLSCLQKILLEYLKEVTKNASSLPVLTGSMKEPVRYDEIAVSKQHLYREYCDSMLSQPSSSLRFHWHKFRKDDANCFIEFESFKRQLENLEKNKDSEAPKFPEHLVFPERILLLTFNYTSISDLYLEDNNPYIEINHIHGRLDTPESVIFGYGDELDEDYLEIRNLNENEYLKNIKSIKYLETPNYRSLLSFIESSPYQIYIWGHSCGNSDRTLLNTLFEHKNCISIKPFYYRKSNGTDNYLEIIQNISRNFTDMKLMRDIVVNKSLCRPLLG